MSGQIVARYAAPGGIGDVAVGADGSVLVAVGGNGTVTLSKFTVEGTSIWRKPLEGLGGRHIVNAIASNADGRIAVGGNFEDSSTITGMPVTVRGEEDLYFAFFTPNGQLESATVLGAPSSDSVARILPGPGGDWFMGGYAYDLPFGGTTIMGGYAARLSPTGTPRWVRPAGEYHLLVEGSSLYSGGRDPQLVRTRTSDGGMEWTGTLSPVIGNLVMRSGAFLGPGQLIVGVSLFSDSTLGGRSFTRQGGSDILLAGIDPASGQVRWAEQVLGSTGSDYPGGLCDYGNGFLYLVGAYGGSDPPRLGDPDSGQKGFIAKIGADGRREWIRIHGSGGYWNIRCHPPHGILAAGQGEVLLVAP
jgi:hypothetical protein